MRHVQPAGLWRNRRFLLRLLASHILVPLVPPVFLLFITQGTGRMGLGDMLGIVLIYYVFGLFAMIALGMPLLFLYFQFGWSGFVPFVAGAGICAGIVSFGFSGPSRSLSGVGLFTIIGGISGALYRTMLFGLQQPASVRLVRTQPEQKHRKYSTLLKTTLTAVAVLTLAASLVFVYSYSDEHRTVTEQMEWECVSVEDADSVQYAHIEHARFWFVKNPNYDERASGPHLCADLKEAGKPFITVTFDVWGNRLRGLHGYNPTSIAAGSKQIKTYDIEGAGLHGDSRLNRFPLEVFK